MLILTGEYKREESVCLDQADRAGLWAVSPNGINTLVFEKDFGLLVDLSSGPTCNQYVAINAACGSKRRSEILAAA